MRGLQIFRELKRNGKIPKVKDLLIASSAIANDKLFERFGLNP